MVGFESDSAETWRRFQKVQNNNKKSTQRKKLVRNEKLGFQN